MIILLAVAIMIAGIVLLAAPRTLIRSNDIGNQSIKSEWSPTVSRLPYLVFFYRKSVSYALIALACVLFAGYWLGING